MSSAPSRSSPDSAVVAAILEAVRGVPAPRIVIDGRSGAGKTTLADEVAGALTGAALVHLDDLYPGWDGLADASAAVHDRVLAPHARGRSPQWRRWDWDASAWAEEHTCDPRRPLVVEGAGALTRRSAAIATVSVWLDGEASVRRARALARDGETYAPHWERWAAQEDAHIAREDPAALATIVAGLESAAGRQAFPPSAPTRPSRR